MNKMQAFKIAAAVRDVLEMGVGCASAARRAATAAQPQLRRLSWVVRLKNV